jgi:hypothetical protein
MNKSLSQLTPNDKKALAQVLKWKEKTLYDCSRGELVDCVLHLTQQVAYLQYKNGQLLMPWYKRIYQWLIKKRIQAAVPAAPVDVPAPDNATKI